jgi:Predicted membrane protein (DUF2157)
MPDSLTGPVTGPDLHEQLTRWMAEGLIDAGQLARIETTEASLGQRPSPHTPAVQASHARTARPETESVPRRTSLIVEALGYLGGALAIAAAFVVVPMLWPRIPTGAELAIAAIATAAFGLGGAVLRVGDDRALTRLRSVLWLLSTVGLAAFMGVLAAQIWDSGAPPTILVLGSTATVYSAVLWWRTRATLQHLATFAGTAIVIGTAIYDVGPGLESWGPGLGVWVLAMLWGTAVHRGYLVPRTAGYIAAGLAMLIGAQLTIATTAGPVLAVGTVAGLLAAGVWMRRVSIVALGAVAVIQILPQAANRYLPSSAAAPLAVFTVGLILVALALWLARSRVKVQSPVPVPGAAD